ncbi:hypothetical protein [Celeribacter sp.]|uniref:hypothetical protein n=1 Tax=Celeribacter sp. TaxID=1890673 RepID=UPI003A8D3872
MSDTDSFIEEVTEEVQRDKLFAIFRKYGWIAVVAVIALVGGASYNEYAKSKARTQAEAAGDAISAALAVDDAQARADALGALDLTGQPRILSDMIRAGELYDVGNIDGAVATLAPYVADATLAPVYRDLAVLKTAMLGASKMDPEERISRLATIASPGAPYRLLAEEQIAVAQIESGQVDAAIEGLRAIAEDGEASQALRRRAVQMIVALGGDLTADTDG